MILGHYMGDSKILRGIALIVNGCWDQLPDYAGEDLLDTLVPLPEDLSEDRLLSPPARRENS